MSTDATLKAYFETGDVPSAAQFADPQPFPVGGPR